MTSAIIQKIREAQDLIDQQAATCGNFHTKNALCAGHDYLAEALAQVRMAADNEG